MVRFLYTVGIFFLFGSCTQESGFVVNTLPEFEIPDRVDPQNGEELLDQLGCLSCHGGVSTSNTIKTKAPDLSHAGLRYQPAYLFQYLQNPERVRNHIGSTRMPDFGFSEKESLALTLYLESLTQVDMELDKFPSLTQVADDPEKGKEIFTQMSCTACHSMNGEGNAVVSDLTNSGMKLKEEWLHKFLIAPHVFRGKENFMPSYFYKTSDEGLLVENMPDASHGVQWISDYLLVAKNDDNAFEQVKKENPGITKKQGESIFKSQNCVACHRSTLAENGRTAPDLNMQSSRVTKEWLDAFLKKPHAVRPFGYPAGRGNRMPDFRLDEKEAEMISNFLHALDDKTEPVAKLSAFKLSKTESLIQNKFSCTGCHSLNGNGGKIGPDLDQVSSRLNPLYVRNLLSNPHQFDAQVIMPMDPVSSRSKEEILSFLYQKEAKAADTEYLSLIDHQPILTEDSLLVSENLYQRNCAICHGTTGGGDGFNAGYMHTLPTNHSDAAYMSLRADDTMFDGIFNGGYYLNKSNQMPAWGQSFSLAEISGLVRYMRELCDCEGPEWSRKEYEAK